MDSRITIVNNEEQFSSPTLQEICIHFCASNAKTLLFETLNGNRTNGKANKLRKSAVLPNKLWEELLENSDKKSPDYFNLVISINDKTSNGLRRLNFSGCTKLIDSDLHKAMRGCPYSLDIHNCTSLTKKTLSILHEFGKNLESLHIGNSSHILPTDICDWISALNDVNKSQRYQGLANSIARLFKKNTPENNCQEFNHGVLQLPNLRKLVIWNLHLTQMQQITLPNQEPAAVTTDREPIEENSGVTVTVDYWEYLMRDFIHNLEYLDLSSCQELSNLNFLLPAKDNLRTLRLHDVLLDYDERTWGVMRNLSKMSFLDVSQYSELASVFPHPDSILENLVTSLPNLSALDISGTNLAGLTQEHSSSSKCGIKGLSSRTDNPLNFLGLLTTHHASDRTNIPAMRIAGGANMEQIVTALQHYLLQVNMSKKVIRILQEKLIGSRENFVPCRTLLRLLYQVTKVHINDKHVLIITIAGMFHLLKRIYQVVDGMPLTDLQLHGIVESILVIVRTYPSDTNLLRNGILVLLLVTSKLNLERNPAMAEDLAITLLAMGSHMVFIFSTDAQMEFFRESIARLMCYILDSGPVVEERLRNGQVMHSLCDLLTDLMDQNLVTHLPIFWSILYRVADCCDYMNPKSCELFLQTEGVRLCFRYLKFCRENAGNETQSREIIDNLNYSQITVLALLTNLVSDPGAECKIIDDSKMEEVMRMFDRDLSQMEGKEVLLHVACGFLACVATKEASRSLVSPSRPQILGKISELMINVDFIMPVDLTFRDLTMLYIMLESCDDSEVHLWSLKTFVYLLNSEPEKFGEMIAKDKRLTVSQLDDLCRKAPLELKTEIHHLSNCIITEIIRYPN